MRLTFVPQDYITERIKKIGGFTSFNMFLLKELDIMYKLIMDIKTSLQVKKRKSFVILFIGTFS